MLKIINSLDNHVVQSTAALKKKKHRNRQGLFLLEGARAFKETYNYPDQLLRFFIQQECLEKYKNLISPYCNKDGYQVNEKIITKISSTENSQGILAVMKIPATYNSEIPQEGFILLLDGISDPGNLGTIIRTAWAMDMQGILLVNNCADPFSPKAVRASMGGVLHVPIFEVGRQGIIEIIDGGRQVYGAAANAAVSINRLKFTSTAIVAIGSEAHGLSPWVTDLCSHRFFIPIKRQVDSINAAVAAGIVMNKMGERSS